jgi:DNA-directed RNA polymerase subunit L
VPSFHRHFIKIQDKKGRKPGDLVKKHIEEAKEEVKQQKLNLQKEWEK